ncbi:MAG: glycosyltransferase [Candidatus Lokiarchaeota archaeon]|nr:glycosyltransferase [Candidatus Lokiarchaeota archaeon]
MKVAILQDKIRVGGRSKVVSFMIEALNNINIIPTILTISDLTEKQSFENHYHLKENENFKYNKLSLIHPKRFFFYYSIFFNLLAKRSLDKFDAIITSTSNIHFLPINKKYLHYIHHPPEAEFKYDFRLNASFTSKLYTLPLKLLYSNLNPKLNNESLLLANSKYTKQRIIEFYPNIKPDDITVIYPPSYEKLMDFKYKKKEEFITIGSFHPNKNQLFQLKIAKEFPQIKFNIIGQIKSSSYYLKCIDYKKKNKIFNVNFYPNCDLNKLADILSYSKYFLHSMKGEHFGISTVEAISYGCIPFVHNSGGQKEIVPFHNLQYNSMQELINKIRKFKNYKGKHSIVNKLHDHIKKYNNKIFLENFQKILINFLK